MLHIIRGRAGSGKTDYLHNYIQQAIDNGDSEPLLIVPEQFSFITERSLLKRLGPRNFKKIKITAFSRLALSYYKEFYPDIKPFADDGVRSVIMLKAIEAVQDNLTVYSGAAENSKLLDSLVAFEKELKLCNVSLDNIDEAAAKSDEPLLKNKLSELSLIYRAFDSILENSYFDENRLLHYFNELAVQNGFFVNKTVYVDAFRAFSGVELECIKIALRQADDVYISFCTDSNEKNNEDSPFAFIDAFEREIKNAANENNVKIAPIVTIPDGDSFSTGIGFIEKNIYTNTEEKLEEPENSVTVAECADADDECRFVACEIKKLLRSRKYRYKEIAVIERTNGVYKKFLCDMLERYNIPVFNDNRRPLISELVFIHLISALECISENFNSESVFRYLKTTLCGASLVSVSELEKYAVTWDINGKAWFEQFTAHPSGYGKEFTDEDLKTLKRIDNIRKDVITPLYELKQNTVDKTGLEISQAVFEFLEKTNVPGALSDFVKELEDSRLPVEAKRKETSWEALVQLLETTAKLTENEHISLKRWFGIFKLLADKKDIGEIPQGLDEVTVGSADRIRTDGIKVVFLVGVNKDEFPLISVKNGILSDRERQMAVTALELNIRPPFEDCVSEERFITYCALTAASEKLYLSYKTFAAGENVECSSLVTDIRNLIPKLNMVEWHSANPIDRIESNDSAFTELARCISGNSDLRTTLYEYFRNNTSYADKLSGLERAVMNKPVSFNSSDTAKELFGKNLRLSATQIDTFSKCPFSYFCRYGIKAEPLEKAEFDARESGKLVHLVLEKLLSEYKDEFINVGKEELKNIIDGVLSDYLNKKMGGADNKSKRFMFLYNRLTDTLLLVIARLKKEFSLCDFKPIDFELKIGGDKISAYSLLLEDGNIEITGSIDRVDLYEKDGIKYIRIIDYKSGKKDFDLSKLFAGLDIQMVLYLMALEKNGTGKYSDIVPSGVLYLPSKIGYDHYSDKRSLSAEEIEAKIINSGKLSGMVLNSPVVFNAMGVDRINNYLPVGYKKDGSSKGSYYDRGHFRKLSERIDNIIIQMGEKLHCGDIPVMPAGKTEGSFGDLPCQYCNYKAICAREEGEPFSHLIHIDYSDAIKELEEDNNG